MYKKSGAILILIIISCHVMGQQGLPLQDSTIRDSTIYKTIDSASVNTMQDSSKYKAIEKFSKKSKLTKSLHRILFRRVIKESVPPVEKESRTKSSQSLAEGRIIRKIEITILDPFGYSISDTLRSPELFLLKAGNSLHVKTREKVIKNLLLFSEYERYDSLLVRESARLIRSQRYIRDIKINAKRVSRDSIDLFIRVSDVWSIVPSYLGTSSTLGLGVRDINFAGFGNSLDFKSLWKRPANNNITRLSYSIPNIRNSYISINLQYLFSFNSRLRDVMEFDTYFFSPASYNPQYMFSLNRNIIRSIDIVRPFYSPRARWAGGIFLGQIMTTQGYLNSDSIKFVSLLTNIHDYWVGRSWQISGDTEEGDQTTNLVLSARMVRTRSPERPPEAINANIFLTQTYYFGNISISSRRYFLDKYIFNYGKIEDVPTGKIFGLTMGMEAQQKSRIYAGFNAGWGGYYTFGYLSAHMSYGTFKGNKGFQEGIFTIRMNYFTRLFSAGNWKIRQFVKPSFISGIKMLPAENLPLKIGIKGFESIESRASNITILSLQTQTYAPWDIAGFRFGPFLFTQFGLLGEVPPGEVKSSRLYSLLGLGLLIRNDYLMFRTFQLSLSFYPFIPDKGYNILKTNAYRTADYGFMDFEVSKPGIFE